MSREVIIAGLLGVVVVAGGCCRQSVDEMVPVVVKGPYLGQNPPDEVPRIFAPEYLPDIGSEHTATMFTRDGTEVFWGRVVNPGVSPRCHVIMHAKQVDGVWGEPELAPFNIGINSFIDSVSPDGQRVYFQAHERTEQDGETVRRWTNWVAHRTGDGWSEPRLLEGDFSWPDKFFDFQETNGGNRYFTSTMEGTGREIGLYVQELVDGSYQAPRPLGSNVNSEHLDYAFYVDHDEEYVLFTSNRPGVREGSGLWVSYRQPDHSWGPARALDAVNTAVSGSATWPYVSPDGRYLFFLSSVDAYEDADVEQGTYQSLKAISQSPENGYLRVYWVSAGLIDEMRPAAS